MAALNLGPGVSRVLDPSGTEFVEVIWQQGRPPLDSEYNLMQEMLTGFSRKIVLRGTPSGWLGNDTNSSDVFATNPTWSNWFQYGRQKTGEQKAVQWAVVNGWMLPITGTRTGTPPGSPDDADTWNKIALDPPPLNSGDFRIDFAFLEVWLARVPPNPSTQNKPSASAIYRYGNVEGGFSYLADDLTDPAIGEETTQRIQVQYRIRVQKGLVGFTSYPDGFDPTVVFAQGGVGSPTSYTFTNMRQTLGDPGLWRAGDGSVPAQTALGSADGYSYAIPICAIFRRNGSTWLGDPSPNLNGAFNRNPLAVDRTGVQTFSAVPTLAANLTASGLAATLVASAGLPTPLNPATPVLIQIGDELLQYSTIAGANMTLTARGVYGSRPEAHKSGATITVLSGRPDGLFADQITKTDILDLRHAVSPNGFDYQALLRGNLDKLLKGQLRANWKRTGAGPQGPFNLYQDKLVSLGGGVALGVTRLDGPDDIRTVFSDAAVPQKIDFIIKPGAGGAVPNVSVSWALNLTVPALAQAVAAQFSSGDAVTVPIAQFKAGLPGGDADQVRFLNDGLQHAVVIRIDGEQDPLPSSAYTVTPANPTPSDDLVITFDANFPAATTQQLYVTTHVQYGAGRGVARRPDSFHSAAFLAHSADMLVRPTGVPYQYLPMHCSWAPMWSKFRAAQYKGLIPVTTECYADLGSKTVAFTPFRRMLMPTEFRAIDGTSANADTAFVTGTVMSAAGSTVLTDATASFIVAGVIAGDIVTIPGGPQPGRYVVAIVGATTLTVDRAVLTGTNIVYSIGHSQGVMPLLKLDGTAKWTTTDPLALFSGTTDPTAPRKNIFVTLPRDLVPGWGEYHVPILWADTSPFSEGINYMSLSAKGAGPFADGNQNYVSYASGIDTFSTLSTYNNNPVAGPAGYNTAWTDTGSGKTLAGLRHFTDARGLNRQGLELPPFYGAARLFAVYEAADYYVNGSAYSSTTRAVVAGHATNLLRQNVAGPTFWVEIDADGDSTFILNADCIDISKSPNPIASFAAGNFVIEANLFGFDRGSFDLSQDFRLVLTRERAASQANNGTRSHNVTPAWTTNIVAGPTCVLPGPLTASDSVVLSYSRTPYQGDAWGSQTNYIDIQQNVGSLASGTAFTLTSQPLNQNALTRPNQKSLEVLASVMFTTTLGTGRISGDPGAAPVYDLRDVGYEDPAAYPPVSGVAARPRVLASAFTSDTAIATGTELLGCTERLPMGSLFRDKDFRGGTFTSDSTAPFRYSDASGEGYLGSLAVSSTLEQTEALVDAASFATGAPGNVVVQVDGEQGNYSLLTNFRTFRGGSAFAASGRYPGGEVVGGIDSLLSPTGHTNVLVGMACLVRNTVTSVGASEVSAGDELMLLVCTTVSRLTNTSPHDAMMSIGANGTSEGYSAADLYRIDGRPLLSNNVRVSIDPSTIQLTRKAF
jgi:hypothetical protein